MPDTCSSLQWSPLRLRTSRQDIREEDFPYLIFFLTMVLLRPKDLRTEHLSQRLCLLRCIDRHQTLERLPTLCHTNVLPTNLQFNIASTNHQHITPININHSILDHVGNLHHLHLRHRNNMAILLLHPGMNQRIALHPRPTRPQAVMTHKTNCHQRLQLRPTVSREYHNYHP